MTGYVDPELREALAAFPGILLGTPGNGVAEERAAAAAAPEPEVPSPWLAWVTDLPASAHRPALRVITPGPSTEPRPAIFWIHGGGYIAGSAFRHDLRLFHWAELLDAIVVSVEYPLAPEAPHPVPLTACDAALTAVFASAAEWDIDPARIVVVGESAGGGLAAALTLLTHSRGGPQPCFQLLIYPMLDDRTTRRQFEREAPVWTQSANRAGWRALLGGIEPGSDDVPATAAAGRAGRDDLVGLPPTFIAVGSLDLFRDEDVAYATALQDADVATELHVYAGTFHASDHLVPTAAVSQRFELDLDSALLRAVGRHPA